MLPKQMLTSAFELILSSSPQTDICYSLIVSVTLRVDFNKSANTQDRTRKQDIHGFIGS